MTKARKTYWMGVSTETDRDMAAVRGWFSPLCDSMTVESAEILCDIETDREKRIRAIMVDAEGKRRVATRTIGQKYSISLKAAQER